MGDLSFGIICVLCGALITVLLELGALGILHWFSPTFDDHYLD